jgi:hypothetical protein
MYIQDISHFTFHWNDGNIIIIIIIRSRFEDSFPETALENRKTGT